jgi:hypothetical protein
LFNDRIGRDWIVDLTRSLTTAGKTAMITVRTAAGTALSIISATRRVSVSAEFGTASLSTGLLCRFTTRKRPADLVGETPQTGVTGFEPRAVV